MANHPCFNVEARGKYGRIHLPVAKFCNVACVFCNRRYACLNESRPGVTVKLLTPEEALESLKRVYAEMPHLAVVGIAGPGDPLANKNETLTVLELVKRNFPELILCLSTNGLELPSLVQDLIEVGVSHLTVTVNAVDPKIGARIYKEVHFREEVLKGEEGAYRLLENQREGVLKLSKAKLTLKINTVVIPTYNDTCIVDIAKEVATWGAKVQNLIPLIPVEGTSIAHLAPPSLELMQKLKAEAEVFIPQMRHCTRCRADAAGLLGEFCVVEEKGLLRLRAFS